LTAIWRGVAGYGYPFVNPSIVLFGGPALIALRTNAVGLIALTTDNVALTTTMNGSID
jgi:hypothetical protein